MTNKRTCMEVDQDLFRKFQKQVKRARYLFAAVFLCENSIELFMFKLDKTGIEYATNYPGYEQQSYKAVKDMLDARAQAMKDQWVERFRRLSNSNADGVWGMDLTKLDHAVLEVGTRDVLQKYYLKWCFEDLMSAATFIADHSNPDLDLDED